MIADFDDGPKGIRKAAVDHVATARHKIGAGDLQKFMSSRFSLAPKAARRIVRELVSRGDLSYTYEYGSSYLEIAFNRPLCISPRLVILPVGLDWLPNGPRATVRIAAGAAFGTGRHPTTRLALRGIETAVDHLDRRKVLSDTILLDIGTGSGILAIAALKLGIARAVGLDVDACARKEAVENAVLNGVETRIRVTDTPLTQLTTAVPFEAITANLRYPSLAKLCVPIQQLLEADGVVVLSGIKADEQDDVMATYEATGLTGCWQAEEKGWVALVMRNMGGGKRE